jgi:hypothetical protein
LFGRPAAWCTVALEQRERTQLLELENDLIASHVFVTGRPPKAQFLG